MIFRAAFVPPCFFNRYIAMDVFVPFVGLSGAVIMLVWLAYSFLNLLWASLSAVLATRRNRNPWSCFFLTLFYGIYGLLMLTCAKNLNPDGSESDTAGKVLWMLLPVPLAIVLTLIFIV